MSPIQLSQSVHQKVIINGHFTRTTVCFDHLGSAVEFILPFTLISTSVTLLINPANPCPALTTVINTHFKNEPSVYLFYIPHTCY